MTNDEFEQLVSEGIGAIPKKFRDLIENVAIVIEDHPSMEQVTKTHLAPGWTLFGLYEGVPKTKRGNPYAVNMPDKITIFRLPILAQSETPEQVREKVKETVWHEIAHHFGMSDDEIHKAEENRK